LPSRYFFTPERTPELPKRTNSFQQSIAFIYNAIIGQGFKVLESEEILDSDGTALREVDILVRGTIAGHWVNIAIECRNRARKDTVEWIDQLIGKYAAADVQKVVAVSASGFTQSARDKARKHQIETLTLQQAEDADWASFVKLGCVLTHSPHLELVSVEALTEDPEFQHFAKLLEWTVTNNKYEYGTLREFLKSYFRLELANKCFEMYNENFGEIHKTLQDLTSPKTFLIESSFELSLVDEAGKAKAMPALRFLIRAVTPVTTLNVKHSILNKSMLSEAEFSDSRGKFTFRAAQQQNSKVIAYKADLEDDA